MAAEFIKSASRVEECPETGLPEVAFVGHSNAGKSTIINLLSQRKSLARVSNTPGKTDLINFYKVDNRFVLVDLPGYGYAARGQQARKIWAPMIEDYLELRAPLAGVVMVFDAARSLSENELNLIDWLTTHDLPIVLAVNKTDKLNQKELSAQRAKLDHLPNIEATVYMSATKKKGHDILLRTVFDKILTS